jgi:biotin carboxylase
VEDGGTISESDPPEFFAEAEELLGASAAAMEISNGPVKGDFVRSESGQLMVIEIAGRLSGGWFASDQILAARGIDLVEIALKFALGIEIFPSDLDAKRQHATAIRYWFPQPGQLQRIEGLEEIKTRSDIIQSDTFFQPGEEIPLTTKHSDRAGFVISRGNSKSQAIQAAESAINQVSFVTT